MLKIKTFAVVVRYQVKYIIVIDNFDVNIFQFNIDMGFGPGSFWPCFILALFLR